MRRIICLIFFTIFRSADLNAVFHGSRKEESVCASPSVVAGSVASVAAVASGEAVSSVAGISSSTIGGTVSNNGLMPSPSLSGVHTPTSAVASPSGSGVMGSGKPSGPKKHIIQVSTYQMVILMLFNTRDKLTYEVSINQVIYSIKILHLFNDSLILLYIVDIYLKLHIHLLGNPE